MYELTSIQTGKKYAGKVVDKSGLVKPKMIENVHSVRESDVCKLYKHFEDNRYHYLILELCSNDVRFDAAL